MNGRLPAWLEEWLGIGASEPGEGTVWRLDVDWSWAPWVTLLAAAIVLAWVVYFYARESADASRPVKGFLTLLRLASMATLVLMIANLVLSFQRTGLPTVAVIVDVSGSMAVGGGTSSNTPAAPRKAAPNTPAATRSSPSVQRGEESRLDLVKSLLAEKEAAWLRRINNRYNLVVYTAATSASPIEGDFDTLTDAIRKLTTDGPGYQKTRLGAVLRQVLSDLKGSPPAAVVLLSDGITTDGETLADAADSARRQGVPLFTVGLGDDQPILDVELVDLLVDDVVFVGDIVTFEATIAPRGLSDKEVTVKLKEASSGDQVLAEAKVTLGPDRQPHKVRLPHRPTQVGDFEFTVEVEPIDGEIQTENNQQTRLVHVREEKIRVLLAQARPSYEYRFLKHLLERDNSIELHVQLQEADSDYAVVDQSAIPVFPVRREELFAYDVIILGDLDLRRMTHSTLTNLREFVEQKGRSLVFIAGERFLPAQYGNVPEIAALLPFHVASIPASGSSRGAETAVGGFVVQPTELGLAGGPMQLGDTPRENRQIWEALPPLYWLFEIGQTKPAARVLAEHPTQLGADGRKLPVFVLQFVGAGKVLFHATDETWRWRFRTGDTLFARYWVQSLRYLARSKLLGGDRGVELTVERHEVRRGEPVRVRVRFFDESLAPAADDGVTVVVERAGGKRRRTTLRRDALHQGVFQATLGAVEPGRYHVLLVRPATEGRAPADDFRVVTPPGELERLEMDVAEMSKAADVSRGKFYRLREAGGLPRDLPDGRHVPIQELPAIPLWNRWWMVLILFGLLISEWVLRKRKGML